MGAYSIIENWAANFQEHAYIPEIDFEIIDEDIDGSGKYQEISGTIELEIGYERFYLLYTQLRQGSYHTDYYYQNFEIVKVMTELEYNAPTVQLTITSVSGIKVNVMSDLTFQVNEVTYPTLDALFENVFKKEQ